MNHVSAPQNGDTMGNFLDFSFVQTPVLPDLPELNFNTDEFILNLTVEETENHQSSINKMEPLEDGLPASGARENIRQPPNSYILFSKEWRKKLAAQYPTSDTSCHVLGV
jgi:hypothetical protein